jgi:hypothetical protein
MTTAKDVAKFMVDELEGTNFLYQETIVHQVMQRFGPGFTGINANGNPSINKDVLSAFNKLTPNAVWDRAERLWRARQPYRQAGPSTITAARCAA